MSTDADSVSAGQRGASSSDISIFKALNAGLSRSGLFIALPIVIGLAIGLWTFSQPRMYAAHASFVPQEAEGGAAGGLAIARQLGIRLGNTGSTQSSEFYVRLLNSLPVLRATVEHEYAVRGEDGTPERMDLVELWVGGSTGSVVPPWSRAVERLRQRFQTSVHPETGIVRIRVSAEDPGLAEQIAQRALSILIDFNIEVRQARGEEEGEFLARRAEEASQRLRTAEAALKQFLVENRNFSNSPELMFRHERLQRMVAIHQEVFTTLLRLQEEARLQALRDTPPLTVLESPEGTALPQARGTVLRTLLGFFLGFLIAAGIAVGLEYWHAKETSDDPEFRHFKRILADRWGTVRRRLPFVG